MKIRHSIDAHSLNDSGQIIFRGLVFNIEDEGDAMRIQARIPYLDDNISDEELPWCLPFLPKFFNIFPKKDELVKIIIYDTDNPNTNREWIGPVISQPQNLSFDPYFYSAMAGSPNATVELDTAPSTLPEIKDAIPKKDEIAVQGRYNADVILRDNELLLRAGKYKLDEFVKPYLKPLKYNRENPAYISLSLNPEGSTTNIVSDKINLISHKGKPKIPSILDAQIHSEILDSLHPVPYGDTLIEFLKLIKNFCVAHIHTGSKLPPNIGAGDVSKIRDFNLDEIVGNKRIRVN